MVEMPSKLISYTLLKKEVRPSNLMDVANGTSESKLEKRKTNN